MTTGSPRPPWRTARRKATSDDQHRRARTRGPRGRPDGPAALRHGRLRRRRQVHPDRPAAARLQGDLRGPARGRGGHQPVQGLRLHRPGPADRRAALRARAGHHHRRGLPLLRDPAAQVHHRRHPGPRAVHPQHGHRRLDRRPRPGAGGRPAGPHRAVPPPRGDPVAAAGAPPGAGGQQDGPRRLRPEGLRQDPPGVHLLRDQAEHPRPRGHPDLGAQRRQRGQALRQHALVQRLLADAPPRERPRRLRPRPGRHPAAGAVRRAPQVRPVPRLPRLRRSDRRRRAQAGRRGRSCSRAA